MNRFQKLFSTFINNNSGKLHFACHSHHYWPDCTREAQLNYWDDSSRLVDDKWGEIFSKRIPNVQNLISEVLNFDRAEDICFAPNTHELVTRVMSSFSGKIKLLTTDSEFYSFSRQLNRLIEENTVEATIIPLEPIDTFEERFTKESHKGFDLVFTSHVFFNSGYAINGLTEFVNKIEENNKFIIVDGYHAFMALPIDLSKIGDKIFYIAGGYKYVGSGEGSCFMTIPKNCKLRPLNTGWFAELSTLDNIDESQVGYPTNGLRFAGSTLDFTSLYRMESVLNLYKNEEINSELIHTHVQNCQREFLKMVDDLNHSHLNRENLLYSEERDHGHFLTFELESASLVESLKEKLSINGVLTDSRKNRLRFGFSIYHDPKEYKAELFNVTL